MQQLGQGELAGAEAPRLRRGELSQATAGMPHEKSLLGADRRGGEAAAAELRGDPVPAHVAGEILLARMGQQGVRLPVAEIGAGGPARGGLAQLAPALAIVARRQQARPRLGGDGRRQGRRRQRRVEQVALGSGRGQRRVRGRPQFDLRQAGVLQADAELAPGPGAEAPAPERLGVEQLVGKHDAGAVQDERLAQAHGPRRAEAVRDSRQDSAGRLGADLNEGKISRGPAREQILAGRGDQLAEQRANGSRGKKIGARPPADPGALPAVVAHRRIVEGERPELVEAQRAPGAGALPERGGEGGARPRLRIC